MHAIFVASCLLVTVAAAALAAPVDVNMHGWSPVLTEVASSLPAVSVRFELKQRNLDILEERFWSVSDPDSPAFGQHMSVEEIGQLIGASQEQLDAVISWIQDGATATEATVLSVSTHATRDYVTALMAPSHVERAFGVHLAPFRHERSRFLIARSVQAAVMPPALAGIVERLSGVSNFPVVGRRFNAGGAVSGFPGENIVPSTIQKVYGINGQGKAQGNGVACAEFEEAYAYISDVHAFQKMYSLPAAEVKVVGPNNPIEGYLGECTLDLEYVQPTCPGVTVWMFSVSSPGFDLMAWALNVTATADAPKVHSISWGSPESDFEADDTFRMNNEFKKLALAGNSILVASGDDGTGHSGFFTCGHFQPQWPASSPYITAVGGTYLESGTESVWDGSGGGFSNRFAAPAFQQSAIKAYLSGGADLPDASYYNATGRGIPDVSALSTNFQTLTQNMTGSATGTSAATPVWAGVIALINDVRMANGKQPLGYLNTMLYSLDKSAFTDIVAGDNRSKPCSKGFPAAAGWDAASGRGTPKYGTLLQQLQSV